MNHRVLSVTEMFSISRENISKMVSSISSMSEPSDSSGEVPVETVYKDLVRQFSQGNKLNTSSSPILVAMHKLAGAGQLSEV